MTSLILACPGNESLSEAVAERLALPHCGMAWHRFPDGETLPRVETNVAGADVAIVCTLRLPDTAALPLLFSAQLLRQLGGRSVGLVAPYLAYMRQDQRFHPGEALTSVDFAGLLSSRFDWIVTIDPHLHRFSSLEQLYRIPAIALHSGALLAGYLRSVARPLLIGPDRESEQWVSAVARAVDAPYLVLTKTRLGDRNVRIDVPDVSPYHGHTPVLLDDIISSAHTMIETLRAWPNNAARPLCLGIHAVFAADAHSELVAARPSGVVTTNTIPHLSNGIDVSPLLADGLRQLRLSNANWNF